MRNASFGIKGTRESKFFSTAFIECMSLESCKLQRTALYSKKQYHTTCNPESHLKQVKTSTGGALQHSDFKSMKQTLRRIIIIELYFQNVKTCFKDCSNLTSSESEFAMNSTNFSSESAEPCHSLEHRKISVSLAFKIKYLESPCKEENWRN